MTKSKHPHPASSSWIKQTWSNLLTRWPISLLANPMKSAVGVADKHPLLSGVQANVLSPHRFKWSSHIFLRLPDDPSPELKQWLRNLAETGRITSMRQQLDGLPANQVLLSVMVSSTGAAKLDWDDRRIPEMDAAFSAGMYRRESINVIVHDDVVGTSEWEDNYRAAANPRQRLDIHLLIAGPDERLVTEASDDLQAEARNAGAEVLQPVESGRVYRNSDKKAVEHFGFVDGISNPQFLRSDIARAKRRSGNRWNPAFPLNQVLVPVQNPDESTGYGSFFVFRKIEQHVKAFRDFETEATAALKKVDPDYQGDPGEFVVGRTRAGWPLALRPPANSSHAGPHNNFNYGSDRQGRGCPFHAHVRKTNPRRFVPEDQDDARDHLFARRGMLYGKREQDGEEFGNFTDQPEGDVGLLFMAYMSNINGQFEHTLRSWMNNPEFPGHQDPGTDSLMGEPHPARVKIPAGAGRSRGTTVNLQRFVTTRGGEYFFVPPIAWFKNL